MKSMKRKSRPSMNPKSPSAPRNSPTSNRRSARRNPNNRSPPPRTEFGDDDDDERKEKKVKLVVRLPQSEEKIKVEDRRHSREIDSGSGSGSGSDSDPELEDREGCAKKRKINGVDHGSGDGVSDQEKDVITGTTTSLLGSPLESGPTTPLPDKKLLVFILDRLQKKDTYGVFSEPVDPNELPDYFEIIEQPMDFGTVRKKLDNGAYKNLGELEADVQLICSNAMQYNSADTVYYRQARTIQDLAKRDFNNLKHEGDNGELQPKVIRRGRPPSNKNQKKSLETSSPVDRVRNELSSGATLAKEEDKTTGSNSYNLRKGPASSRVRPTDPFVTSYGLRNGENHSEWSVDWNREFPASILRADMKYGKKHFIVDENRRDTYRQFHSMASGNNSLVLSTSIANMKRLVPVGLQEALAYARSLARYASNLGPVAWKMASRKIEATLPSGVQYGPGWIGDKDSPSQTTSAANFSPSNPRTPSTAIVPPQGVVEAVRKLNSTNGFSGLVGYDDSSPKSGNSVAVKMKTEPGNDLSSSYSPSVNHMVPEQAATLMESSRDSLPPPSGDEQGKNVSKEMWDIDKPSGQAVLPLQQRNNNINNNDSKNILGAPDLNVRFLAGSPSSSLQIGSPQQPDLALQL